MKRLGKSSNQLLPRRGRVDFLSFCFWYPLSRYAKRTAGLLRLRMAMLMT
jgi:hypothetical protein